MKSSKDTGINWARAIPGLGTLIDLKRTIDISSQGGLSENGWTRHDFLLLCAGLLGFLTGCAGILDEEQEEPIPTRVGITPRVIESPIPEIDPIPYLVDLNSPLPYNLDDFEDPEIARWKPNWQNEYPDISFPIILYPESQFIEAGYPNLSGYSRANLPRREEIPKGVLSVPLLRRIIVDDVPELVELRNMVDSQSQFEMILRHCPPVVFQEMFALESVPAGMAGERARLLWERLAQINILQNKATKLQRAYEEIFPSIKDVYKSAQVSASQNRVSKQYLELTRIHDDTIIELLSRMGNTHLIRSDKIHPGAKYERGVVLGTYCYGFVANIIDLHCQMKGVPEDSPLTVDNEGYFMMNDPGNILPDNRFNIENLFTWFETLPRGWKEIRFKSHADLLALGREYYFVELQYANEILDNPSSASILRTIPQNGKYPEFLARVRLEGGLPNGEMYTPVFPTEYQSDASYRTKRIFAHPY